MRLKKIVEAADAIAVIHSGDTVASAGYAGSGTPDQLFVSLERRYTSGAFLRHKLGTELAKREVSSEVLHPKPNRRAGARDA